MHATATGPSDALVPAQLPRIPPSGRNARSRGWRWYLPPPSSPLPNPGTGPTPARAGLSGIARKSLVAGCSKSEESCARWDP